MSHKLEIYFSCDVEADGPLPGRNNMVSFGCVAFLRNGTRLGRFSANLLRVPGFAPDPATMAEFWEKNPEAWAAAIRNPENPVTAMRRFADFVDRMLQLAEPKNGNALPVFAGYPAPFDHAFIRYYAILFLNRDLFGHAALDLRSYAMALMNVDFRHASKRNMPSEWFSPTLVHTHVAVDDADAQGELLISMLNARDRLLAAA